MFHPCAGAAVHIGQCGSYLLTGAVAIAAAQLGGGCGVGAGALAGVATSEIAPGCVPQQRQKMLLCDVYLGSKQTLTAANGDGLLSGFDSGFVPGGSAARTAQYVVYHQRQAIPRYVIDFDRKMLR